jgi:hypothetical protein
MPTLCSTPFLFDALHHVNQDLGRARIGTTGFVDRLMDHRLASDGVGWRLSKRLIRRALLAVSPAIYNFSPCSQGGVGEKTPLRFGPPQCILL